MKINTTLTSLSIVVLTGWMGSTALAAAPPTTTPPPVFHSAGDMALPANAQAGKCYARVFEDPKYRMETEEVLKKQASERIEIIPAKHEIVEEQVLVRAAYEKEQIIPAQFETVTEKILVKPASTRWKKGRGLVEKVNNFTGEIMCLEEVPAEYKTVTKQMVKVPATKKLVQVPAEYKTVRINKMITPARENRIPIPAEYQTVTKTIKESEGRMVWQGVLCETNAPELVKAKPAFTEIQAQPRSVPSQEKKDWFFLWDYDELFNKGKWVRAEEANF
jgi:hypothetical protein